MQQRRGFPISMWKQRGSKFDFESFQWIKPDFASFFSPNLRDSDQILPKSKFKAE